MKIVFDRDTLLNGLSDVQSVVNPRTTLPILSNLLIQAEGDRVILRATDLDITIETSLIAAVEREGGITLPAKRLHNLIRELPNQQIELDVDDKYTATITCGSSYVKLVGIAEEEYPKPPEFEGNVSHQIDQEVFKDMLKHVIYAAAQEEARVALNSCLLTFKEGKLAVVATDGRRLALMEHEMEFPESEEIDIVLPLKTAEELKKLLDDGPLKIKASKKQVAFEFGNVLILSKLTEQEFPTFRKVIPQNLSERVTLEREALLNAVRRVSLMTNEQSNEVKMTFGNNRLELVTITPDVGEAREKFPIKYDRKEITMIFNSGYLIEPLKSLSDIDEIYIEFSDEFSPALIKADIPFLYVIMPLRVNKTSTNG